MADVTTARAASKVDLAVTYTNALTSGAPLAAKIPIIAKSDRAAIGMARRICSADPTRRLRIAHIRNTKELDAIWLSEGFAKELSEQDNLEKLSDFRPYKFDDEGNLQSPSRLD
jgi:hypothetical protein